MLNSERQRASVGRLSGGVPAFFNTTLHEDTDFSSVDWKKAETDNIPVDYAIRAWSGWSS